MHHVRTEHSEIKDETNFIGRESEITLLEENQYVNLHNRQSDLMTMNLMQFLPPRRLLLPLSRSIRLGASQVDSPGRKHPGL